MAKPHSPAPAGSPAPRPASAEPAFLRWLEEYRRRLSAVAPAYAPQPPDQATSRK